MIQSKKWQVPFYVLMSALSLTMIFPFLWMVSTSFKFDTQVFTVPVEWIPDPVNLSNYTQVWVEEPFLLYYKNTVVVAVFATAGQVIISAMAAYAFSSIEFRGKNILFSLYLATMMVPWHTIMIPQYQIISRLGLTDAHAALILGQLASAFGIFLLRQFFLTVPRELMEAARIDGAGEGYIFSKVMLPLAKPALSTLIIFTFVQVWNLFKYKGKVHDSAGTYLFPVGTYDAVYCYYGGNGMRPDPDYHYVSYI